MKSLIKSRLPSAVHGGRRQPNWKENDEILNAAGVNDVNTLHQLSSKGVDVTAACNWNESTTLHIAAQRGSYQAVKMLLDINTKTNVTNNVKSTPLHYASGGGHQQVVKLLIDSGALIRCKDKDSKTPLHLAANRGHYEVVKMLVDAGATVDAKDKHGNTPLSYAIKNNHRAVVNYLINEAKASVSKISKELQYSYKTQVYGQQKLSHDQVSSSQQSSRSMPSHLSSNPYPLRYVQQQRRPAHVVQRTQPSTSQVQTDHKPSLAEQLQYHNLYLQLSKQMQQMSQSQPKQQTSRQSLHIEVQIQMPPSMDPSQENKQEQLPQPQLEKQQQNLKSTSPSTTSQCDQEEKSKHEKVQLQREHRSQKNGLVQERMKQKLVEEAEVSCIEEDLLYGEDHSVLHATKKEINSSTSDSISDVTEKSSIIDNDETCSEVSSVTNDVSSAVNASSPTAQEIQQVTNGDYTSEQSSDTENSPTTVTRNHLSHQLLQPHPHSAAQQSINGANTANMQNTSLQDQQAELQHLPNLPHQQPFNCYPGYQPFYHQQDQSSSAPSCHYLPAHHPAHPHLLYRHYTVPVISYPFAHHHQQEAAQQHACSSEHRSSSPAVLEHIALPQNYTTHYNLQPPVTGYVTTQANMVSPQHATPMRSPSPMLIPSSVISPSPIAPSPITPSPIALSPMAPSPIAPSPITFQDVNNQQLLTNGNNLPTNPQHIDSQLQELTRQIETLKSQRDAYERASKQNEANVDRTVSDDLSPKEISVTNSSDTATTDHLPHAVIDATTPDDELPSDIPCPNANLIPALQNNGQQPNSGNQLISNLFSSFQPPSQAGAGGNVVVQMLVMQDNNIAFPSSATLSIDYQEDNHNSLKSFTTDIYSAIDVDTILPFMVKNGLLTPSQHQYFLNPYHTFNDKQNKLTCIAVTANEECVEKFLLCLQETSYYKPHETLLKRIRDGTEQMNE